MSGRGLATASRQRKVWNPIMSKRKMPTPRPHWRGRCQILQMSQDQIAMAKIGVRTRTTVGVPGNRRRLPTMLIRATADSDMIAKPWITRCVLMRLTTQAQRPGPRDATIATATLPPGSLQRMVRPRYSHAQSLSQALRLIVLCHRRNHRAPAAAQSGADAPLQISAVIVSRAAYSSTPARAWSTRSDNARSTRSANQARPTARECLREKCARYS